MIRKSSICFQWTEQREEKSFFDGYFAILVIFFERHFYFKNCIAHEKSVDFVVPHYLSCWRSFSDISPPLRFLVNATTMPIHQSFTTNSCNTTQPNSTERHSCCFLVQCTLYTPERPKFNYNLYRLFLCADRKNKKKKLLSYNLFY